jgi:hypothetical protein
LDIQLLKTGFYNKKNRCDWTGKRHKNESKNKISKANSIHQQGKGNSQYGTCWIHDSEKSFRIKKEDLESYLQRGYIKGRKMFKNI